MIGLCELKMIKYLVSKEEVLKAFLKEKPDSKINEIYRTIGDIATFALLEKMESQVVYFPSRTKLQRLNKMLYIRKELKERHENKEEFSKRVKEIAKLLGMTESAVVRTFMSEKYCE